MKYLLRKKLPTSRLNENASPLLGIKITNMSKIKTLKKKNYD